MGIYLIVVAKMPGRVSWTKGLGIQARSILADSPELQNCRLLHETLTEATLCFETMSPDWRNNLVSILEGRGVRLTYVEPGNWLR